MTTVMGCIADDFTGATDLAGLLARSGVKVSLRIGIPDEPPKDTSPFEVIALKSRTSPVNEAINESISALKWLQDAGAKRFFFKYCSTFDSTSEGNIGPVAESLMTEIEENQTIYCPAFPENGRSIFMGNLFVGQQLLSESSMKDHPLTPMIDSNLMRLLTPQVTHPIGLIDRLTVAQGDMAVKSKLNQLKKDGVSHVVVDAVANEDLEIIAKACKDLRLITGGSALAMPLPEIYLADGLLPKNSSSVITPSIPQETIILSGSCSSMTNAQVAQYIETGAPYLKLDPLELTENGSDYVFKWLSQQDLSKAPIIFATADPESVKAAQAKLGIEQVGELIEQTLASCAVKARDAGARRIIVAGGETSGAVTKSLNISQLDVSAEIAPGVPWTFCNSNGIQIALTLKSGNFGSENFFSDAQNKLDQL